MFTGIVEEIGTVSDVARTGSVARLLVSARAVMEDLEIGGSIAVNGCCLTAIGRTARMFAADLSPETLERTTLGTLRQGAAVNLERPVQPTGRLSGHFVLGHVDGTGGVLAFDEVGDGSWWLSVQVPRDLLKFLVYKGSVAVDGISLTVASLKGPVMGVAIIPHTYEVTALSSLRVGSRVNLECDILSKQVHRLLEARAAMEAEGASGKG